MAIYKIVEETTQDLQEWKRLEESWGKSLKLQIQTFDSLMKYETDEANGGI